MSSMPSAQEVTLYIHPDKGPIKPIQLNLMEIEVAVHNSRMSTYNRDEERLRQVALRIKQAFPYVDPNSNRNGIMTVLSRFSSAYQFNGMVLRLSGTIEDDGASQNDGIKRLNSEVDALTKEVPRLRRLLEIEQQAHRATKEQVMQVQAENSRLIQDRDLAYDRNKMRLDDLQARLQLREEENRRLREESEKIIRAHSALNVQHEMLKTSYEELQEAQRALQQRHDESQRRLTTLENELARLRLDAKNAKTTEEQLRETIERLEDENRELEDMLRGGQTAPSRSQGWNEMLPP